MPWHQMKATHVRMMSSFYPIESDAVLQWTRSSNPDSNAHSKCVRASVAQFAHHYTVQYKRKIAYNSQYCVDKQIQHPDLQCIRYQLHKRRLYELAQFGGTLERIDNISWCSYKKCWMINFVWFTLLFETRSSTCWRTYKIAAELLRLKLVRIPCA